MVAEKHDRVVEFTRAMKDLGVSQFTYGDLIVQFVASNERLEQSTTPVSETNIKDLQEAQKKAEEQELFWSSN